MLRSYYKSSSVKQYENGNLPLRTETHLNDTYHLSVGRRLANLPTLKQSLAAATDATSKSRLNCSTPASTPEPWPSGRRR